jgi:hypothetical protein
MLTAIALPSQLHFLANKHAVLVGYSDLGQYLMNLNVTPPDFAFLFI